MTVTHCEIHLDSLRFYAFHGVLPQERTVGGYYTVDLRLQLTDATGAIESDELSATVNYAEAYHIVQREMAIPSALLEHVSGRILHAIFEAFPLVASAIITLRKDTPPMGADCDGCAVTIEAHR